MCETPCACTWPGPTGTPCPPKNRPSSYTLPAAQHPLIEHPPVTVRDITGPPAEASTHYATPGCSARHPEALSRLPDDNAKALQKLAQLRFQVETFGRRPTTNYGGY